VSVPLSEAYSIVISFAMFGDEPCFLGVVGIGRPSNHFRLSGGLCVAIVIGCLRNAFDRKGIVLLFALVSSFPEVSWICVASSLGMFVFHVHVRIVGISGVCLPWRCIPCILVVAILVSPNVVVAPVLSVYCWSIFPIVLFPLLVVQGSWFFVFGEFVVLPGVVFVFLCYLRGLMLYHFEGSAFALVGMYGNILFIFLLFFSSADVAFPCLPGFYVCYGRISRFLIMSVVSLIYHFSSADPAFWFQCI